MVYALQAGCTIEEQEEFEEELQREVGSKVRVGMGDSNAHARRELDMLGGKVWRWRNDNGKRFM